MNFEEEIVKQYLVEKGFKNIIYEPILNESPDFLVEGKIAIEVRRLNKHHKFEPIEKVEYNVIPKIINLIESFNIDDCSKTSIFSIFYQRPISFKKNKKRILVVLKLHSKNLDNEVEYNINKNLSIRFYPSEINYENNYELGGIIDHNKGGFVIKDIIKSLEIIIPEKANKIKLNQEKFETWWLILVDYIGNGIRKNEEIEILNFLKTIQFPFTKIIIIPYLKQKEPISFLS